MPGVVWGTIILLVLFGLGARISGVKFSFWKVLVAASALVAAIAVGAKFVERAP